MSKSLHFLFSWLGWGTGGLALKMLFAVRVLLTIEDGLYHMVFPEDGPGTSGTKRPRPEPYRLYPQSRAGAERTVLKRRGDSWIFETYGDKGKASSSAPHQGQQEAEAPNAAPTNNAPPEMAANDPYWRQLFENHTKCADRIREIHQELHTRVPGGRVSHRNLGGKTRGRKDG